MLPNVQLSFGPMLIGVYLNLILYGILVMQTSNYYQVYRNDKLWLKLLVLYLFILETANTIFNMQMMYEPLIINFGEPPVNFPTLFIMEPIIIVLVSTPIQFFFAHRIRALTKWVWIPLITITFALGSLAGGLWTGIRIPIVKTFANKPRLHWSALTWFLCACLSDVIISVSLVFSLSRRKTGFSATDSVIDRIIRMTIQTGAITAICAIGDVAFFMLLPHTALNFIWDLALSKLYVTCMMSTLNARASLNTLSDKFSTPRNVVSTLTSRRPIAGYPEHGQNSYELGSGRVYDHKGFDPDMPLHRGADLEYGITVTRVVERLEDPTMASPR